MQGQRERKKGFRCTWSDAFACDLIEPLTIEVKFEQRIRRKGFLKIIRGAARSAAWSKERISTRRTLRKYVIGRKENIDSLSRCSLPSSANMP